MTDIHLPDKMMQHALALAQKGIGYTWPNPLVGAVVVKNGKIVGEGYHEKIGGHHAEVHALQMAKENAEGSDLFVTLEPCSHYGKTPPCTESIIKAGIARVFVAMRDPNPLVNGKGLAKLNEHGIKVHVGIREKDARRQNRPFIKFITQGKPLVTLKLAQTLDGRIADAEGASKWISGSASRKLVHQWRTEVCAVLVGIGTVLEDNPRLTARDYAGPQPVRIVLDRNLMIPGNCHLVQMKDAQNTIIFADENQLHSAKAAELKKTGLRIFGIDASQADPLSGILEKIAHLKIAHIMVEGGSGIASSFLAADAVDDVKIFIAPRLFGEGTAACSFKGWSADAPLKFENETWRRVGKDILFEGDVPGKQGDSNVHRVD